MIGVTGTELMAVIRQLGDVEWARSSPLNEGDAVFKPRILFTVWRYKQPNEALEQRIASAVQNFQGHVEWEMARPGRNWVIAPKALREFREARKFRIDVEARIALAQEQPELCTQACNDLPLLAKHILRCVTAASADSGC